MPDGLLALALGAGLLAAVNPCGFALLPAYLSLLIVGDQPRSRLAAVARALRLTAAMTIGFAGVFAVFGLAVEPVASQVQGQLPYLTAVLGALLVIVGAVLLAGRTIRLPHLRRRRAARPLTGTFGSNVAFGAGYALASLSCTVAPFLAVVVTAFHSDSFGVGAALFLAYAAGMGLVVGTAAVATALASDTFVRALRRSGRFVPRASGLLLLLSGLYVTYYGVWEVRVLRGGGFDDPVVSRAESLQISLARSVGAVGATGWLLLGLTLVALALLLSRLPRRTTRP